MIDWLTTDEWIFFGLLTLTIYGIGGTPRLAAWLFGDGSPSER